MITCGKKNPALLGLHAASKGEYRASGNREGGLEHEERSDTLISNQYELVFLNFSAWLEKHSRDPIMQSNHFS